MRARAAQSELDADATDKDLSAAIEAVRQAIAHLRLSSRFGATIVTLGFVLSAIC